MNPGILITILLIPLGQLDYYARFLEACRSSLVMVIHADKLYAYAVDRPCVFLSALNT